MHNSGMIVGSVEPKPQNKDTRKVDSGKKAYRCLAMIRHQNADVMHGSSHIEIVNSTDNNNSNFETNDSDITFILLQRRFDASRNEEASKRRCNKMKLISFTYSSML